LGGWVREVKAGFMFLELLLAAIVVMFLAFAVFKLYFKQPQINQETQKVVAEQGIDTTSYKSTVESVRSRVEDIQNKHFEELDKIE
jgi:uncharacterized protein YpmS